MLTAPYSLVSLANLLRVPSVPLSTSLTKMLNVSSVLLLMASHHTPWILVWSQWYGSMPTTGFLLMVVELSQFTKLAEIFYVCLAGLVVFRLILDTAYRDSDRANIRTITRSVWQ